MNVVGIDRSDWCEDDVHTIDLWYSDRRRCWIVERLNVSGHLVGAAHCCSTMHDAEACLAEWLRMHDEAHVTSPRSLDIDSTDVSDQETSLLAIDGKPLDHSLRHAA